MSLARGCQSAISTQKEVVILDDFEMGYTLAVHRCPHCQIAKPPLSRRSLQGQRIDSIGAVLETGLPRGGEIK